MNFYFNTIVEDRDDERLDKFLRRQYPEIRMSVIQKFLRSGKVIVEERRVKDGSYRLEIGEKVLVKLPGTKEEILAKYGRSTPTHLPFDMELEVIYEDDDMVAVNKPAGLSVQPGTKTSNKSVYNALLSYGTEFFFVHRLDKYTSGVLLIAKNHSFARKISSLFFSHEVEKRYVALANGLVKSEAEFKTPIDGKPAFTTAAPIDFFTGFTLLDVGILTGRKHQIRIHLAQNDTPVVGDDLYGDTGVNEEFRHRYGLKGYFLHCSTISFTHPLNGKKITLKAPLDAERAGILEAMRVR